MLTVLALATLFACALKVDGDALYAADQCRRVTVIDAETGAAVVGAEDLAFDAATGRVLISAYDRRAVERAARVKALVLPEGGLYAAPIAALAGDRTTLTLPSFIARETVAGGLRPHGLTFDSGRREITFINRSYQKIDGKWRMTPRLERAGADGAVFIGDGGAPRCSANDVATLGERTLVSFDHAQCGWRGGVEDLFAWKVSGVATADGDELFDGARHANGVAATAAGEIVLAATRDKALLLLDPDGDRFKIARKILLPGAPDNLTTRADGMIVAALHPSLIGVGLQRRLSLGRGGSRIVRIDPESGAVTLLFEDPDAQLFSAATAALEIDNLLIIGSVADQGLVVCKRGESAS